MAAIEALGAVGSVASPFLTAGVQGTAATSGPGAAAAAAEAPGGFATTLVSSLERVQQLHATSSELGVRAATGDLTDVHDYTIASTQARVATEVTVAVRNKALEAFNDIMRMQV
jgi:flagellar hook-basal body complex protein FliE